METDYVFLRAEIGLIVTVTVAMLVGRLWRHYYFIPKIKKSTDRWKGYKIISYFLSDV